MLNQLQKKILSQPSQALDDCLSSIASDTQGYFQLPRGAVYFSDLSIGPMQIGCPPETVKDAKEFVSERAKSAIPQTFVIRDDLFDHQNKCIAEEPEFVVSYNFFILGRKTRIVCTEEQQKRITTMLTIAIFAKRFSLEEITKLYPQDFPVIPDLAAEFEIFSKGRTLEDLVEFYTFDKFTDSAYIITPDSIGNDESVVKVIRLGNNHFEVIDYTTEINGEHAAQRYRNIHAPFISPTTVDGKIYKDLSDVRNAIVIIGSRSGFDEIDQEFDSEHVFGQTVGLMIIDDSGRITVIDPPINFKEWCAAHNIDLGRVTDVVLTHLHADHDAGLLELILTHTVNVYTTETNMSGFLEKGHAYTNLGKKYLLSLFNFYPLTMYTPTQINGFSFEFSHSFHSNETIRFTFSDHEGHAYYYSADILYSRRELQQFVDAGFIGPERMEQVMTIPQDAYEYIHEQGVPPTHTPPEGIEDMSDYVRHRTHIVHNNKLPTMKNGEPIPGIRLARPGVVIPLVTPAHPLLDYQPTLNTLIKVQRIPFFQYVISALRKHWPEVAHVFKTVTLPAGQMIVAKGKKSDRLLMLLDGAVNVVTFDTAGTGTDGEQDRNAGIFKRSDIGYLIGDAFVTHEDIASGADIYVGNKPATFIEIDHAGRELLQEKVPTLFNFIAQMRKMREYGAESMFDVLDLFKGVNQANRQASLGLFVKHPLRNDDDRWLVREGQENESVYVVLEGTAKVIIHHDDGEKSIQRVVATLGSNIFGEISVLTDDKTIASVYITSELPRTKVIKISKRNFIALLRKMPGLNYDILKNMQKRQEETEREKYLWLHSLRRPETP